ncbi:MAG: nicotinate-nucleotide--dimethylbenzimidazole phosphoribosyltransferase [Candidatus Pacebacteria bacterium]|nr:nicotinate-nucleotide--dimethylbenzimidazole phosphoribosyltransferase [Candidatus Paceibacterota bacterium]
MTPQFPRAPVATYAEILSIIAEFPAADLIAAAEVAARDATLTKPAGSLGRLEDIAVWLASWQGTASPHCDHPRVAVFAANHGIAARGVSAFPPEVTKQMVANFLHGGAAINQLCRVFDADLRVYELDLDHPTADFTAGAAMTESDAMTALAYGMMAVEPAVDIICVGEMGIANTTAAAALCHGIFGGEARDWVGRGTGVTDSQLAIKTELVAAAVVRHRDRSDQPLALLAALGGREFCAMVGAIIAARMARVPVILDGFVSCAAAAVVYAIDKNGLDHCLVGHVSAEAAHRRLIARLGKSALLDLNMRLGEGSGAALALGLVRAAVACHKGMATFAEAAVSGKGG